MLDVPISLRNTAAHVYQYLSEDILSPPPSYEQVQLEKRLGPSPYYEGHDPGSPPPYGEQEPLIEAIKSFLREGGFSALMYASAFMAIVISWIMLFPVSAPNYFLFFAAVETFQFLIKEDPWLWLVPTCGATMHDYKKELLERKSAIEQNQRKIQTVLQNTSQLMLARFEVCEKRYKKEIEKNNGLLKDIRRRLQKINAAECRQRRGLPSYIVV